MFPIILLRTIKITIKRKNGKGDKLLDFTRSDSEKGAMD